MEMDPDRIRPFYSRPRTDPHLLRSGLKSPSDQTRRPVPDATRARGEGAAARGVGVEARGDGVAARGNRHDDDCRLLSGTPLPSPFSPPTLGLAVATAAAAGEPSMPPAHWVSPPLRNMYGWWRPAVLDVVVLDSACRS
jgi:hypothetical protein